MLKESYKGWRSIPGLATEVSCPITPRLDRARGEDSFWNHLRTAVGEDCLVEAVVFVKGSQPTLAKLLFFFF